MSVTKIRLNAQIFQMGFSCNSAFTNWRNRAMQIFDEPIGRDMLCALSEVVPDSLQSNIASLNALHILFACSSLYSL